MIEVFKTNVERDSQAKKLVEILHEHFPNSDINFDLDDCDKILRARHHRVIAAEITPLFHKLGFACEELPD